MKCSKTVVSLAECGRNGVFSADGIGCDFLSETSALYVHSRGHDGLFHISRIYFISQEMENGNPFAGNNHTVISDSGYASSLFYGDIFLYPAAALHAFSSLHLYTVYDPFQILLYYDVVSSMYCVPRRGHETEGRRSLPPSAVSSGRRLCIIARSIMFFWSV